MGLFDYFRKKKPKLPLKKFDLKLPNGMIIGDYLLLNTDEDQKKSHDAEFDEKTESVLDNTNPLQTGTVLYEAQVKYYSSQIKEWSFKRACNARNIEDFIRSIPYIHDALHVVINRGDVLIRSQNEYQRLLQNRDTIKEYDVRIYANNPKKLHLDAYGEHNRGHFLLVHPFYSYQYNILKCNIMLQMELNKYSDKERTESENEAREENLNLSHYAYLIAGWSFSQNDSQENKYKFLKNNREIMGLLYKETFSKEVHPHKFSLGNF